MRHARTSISPYAKGACLAWACLSWAMALPAAAAPSPASPVPALPVAPPIVSPVVLQSAAPSASTVRGDRRRAASIVPGAGGYVGLNRGKLDPSRPGALPSASPQDRKVHKVAQQFEAVFLTEMLRMARPADKAAKGFSAGESGSTWQVFMDQALGDAAARKGGTGMARQIEATLRHGSAKAGMP